MWLRNALRSFLQCCRWVVARRTLVAVRSHVWNPLCTNFSLPQSVGEDIIYTCWRVLTYVAFIMHEILHTHSKTDFTSSMWHSSFVCVGAALWGASSVSSQPFLMLLTHQWAVSYEGGCVPKPFFNDSRALLPNITWNLINVLMSLYENLPCTLSWSIATKQQLTSQSQYTLVTAASATHVIWVQSYEVLHGATTIHKTSEMTRVHWSLATRLHGIKIQKTLVFSFLFVTMIF
jgi:hypothetical protein